MMVVAVVAAIQLFFKARRVNKETNEQNDSRLLTLGPLEVHS